MGARSETDAVHDVYRDYEKELQEFIKGMNPQVNQIGIAVFINDAFNCMDLFSHQDVLERLWNKLLKSYAMEALEMKQERKSREQDIESVLAALYEAEVMEYPSVGLGKDIRLKKERFIAAGLIYEENVMHLAAFQIDRRARSEGLIARPSRRQRGL
jgi:hypothetical protein